MYMPPKPGSKIIIVGGGCFGLSTAFALALKKKYHVVVFDRQPIPSSDAASTDISKCVRYDYGNKLLYMQLTMEAMPHWHQWNKERAEQNESPVFEQTGVLLMGYQGTFGPYEEQSMQAICEAGYGHAIEKLLTPESIIQKYPQFEQTVRNGYDIAYVNKDGGWCNSEEAIKHLYGKCVGEGVDFVVGQDQGCFEDLWLDDNDKGIVKGIVTQDGTHHVADTVLMTTGAWTASLVDVKDQLQATGHVVMHFEPKEPLRQSLASIPAWAADITRTGYYGFPVNADGKLKIAHHFESGYLNPREKDHVSTPRTHVDHANDTIPISAVQHARASLAEIFPATSSMDITYTRTCWYSDSVDGGYLVSPHPSYKNLVIASGDSGHGMKVLPVIGYKICHVIEGIESDYSRAWAWRTTTVPENQGNIGKHKTMGDGQHNDRFATQDELLC
ncbi:FAD dependent oxidoreductase [Absidia repens]|uniref:FAD dependent oxidoreductase n=1 Tax=Absidia repens TaxID=90262 RepID=A0A1X2IZS5_9FUNG|nr:FAD dependent oxidoreductase [Absidia repens]